MSFMAGENPRTSDLTVPQLILMIFLLIPCAQDGRIEWTGCEAFRSSKTPWQGGKMWEAFGMRWVMGKSFLDETGSELNSLCSEIDISSRT